MLITSFLMTSCIEDFRIDTEDGEHLVGINGYFTNEYKKHQIVISKTTDFYSEEDAERCADFMFSENWESED